MEIVAEMALGGPGKDSEEDEQELETTPDLFAKIRPLLMTAGASPGCSFARHLGWRCSLP